MTKIKHAVSPIAIILKYFSINCLMPGPNFHIRNATKKNLAPRLTNEAIKNIRRFISNTPDVTVKTL